MQMLPVVAGGTIRPSRFVIPDTTTDHRVLEASTTTSKILGVSQKGTRNTPYGSLDDTNAALVGENLHIFGPGCTAPIQLGGTVAAGDSLTATTAGKAVATTTDQVYMGGWALEAGGTDDIIEMQVWPTQHA